MRIVDNGHAYELDNLDSFDESQILLFVKRVGDKYPGNLPPSHGGTTMQEVLRALIDRARYVNCQLPCAETQAAIGLLEASLLLFELRAARKHGRQLESSLEDIVKGIGKCKICGHVGCVDAEHLR